MTSESRTAVLRTLAELLGTPTRPVLVAVDGADGAGKTWFADAWASELASRETLVERATVDDFHHPRAHRHAHGRTGETVWERSFDYHALRRELVDPWLAGPGSSYRTRWHDLVTDEPVRAAPRAVPPAGVLLVDGVFAQRDELVTAWDMTVWLEAPAAVRVSRMAVRDGTPDDVDDPEQARYLQAQRIYAARCRPLRTADVVVDNADPQHPRLLVGPPGARWEVEGDEVVWRVPGGEPG